MTQTEFETRALSLLYFLTDAEAKPSVRAISEQMGMSRSTTHRVLQALTRAGYVLLSAEGHYSIGPRLIQLAARALSASPGASLVEDQMRALVAEIDETSYLAMYIPSDQSVTFVRRVDCTKPLRYVQPLGTQRSLHAGAAGKAILAFSPTVDLDRLELTRYTEHTITSVTVLREELARIRDRGFATSIQEHVEGAAGVAAAITSSGTVFGSLALTVPIGRIPAEGLDALGSTVRRYADELGRLIGISGTAIL